MMTLSLLIALGSPASASERTLDSITIRTAAPEPVVLHHDLSIPERELELGVVLAGAAVVVGHRAEGVTVEVQYETSISLYFEGPHWDLTDFVHGRSPWLAAERAEDGQLHIPEPSGISDMPPVSSAQLEAAVRAYLGDEADEIEALPTCASPTSGPCDVSLSAVYLRVTAWEDGAPTEQRTVKIKVPMGC